jgi:hypothetical protein
MKVVADEEVILGGGKVTPEEKKEYMDSYYGFISAYNNKDYPKIKEYSDKLIDKLHNFVLNEINDLSDSNKEKERLKKQGYTDEEAQTMLYNDEDITGMKEDLNKIWSSILEDQVDEFMKINVISFQCVLLFMKYSKNREYPHFINITPIAITTDSAKQIDDIIQDELIVTNIFLDFNQILNWHSIEYYCDHQIVLDDNDKDRLEREFLEQDSRLPGRKEIKNNSYGKSHIYRVLYNIMPFLSITDILDIWLDYDVWVIGVSTRYKYVDGDNWFSPIGFIAHDLAHSSTLHNCYKSPFGGSTGFLGIGKLPEEKQKYETFQLLKEFYNYCKNVYNKSSDEDKFKLTCIKLILFLSFHEAQDGLKGRVCDSYYANASDEASFESNLLQSISTLYKRLSNPRDLFLSLPLKVRKDSKNETSSGVNDEIVKKFFKEECVPIYAKGMRNFQLSKKIIADSDNDATKIAGELIGKVPFLKDLKFFQSKDGLLGGRMSKRNGAKRNGSKRNGSKKINRKRRKTRKSRK